MAQPLVELHGQRVGIGTASGDLIIENKLAASRQRVVAAATPLVQATAATLALTADAHSARVVVASRAAGVTFTLPAAEGTGDVYTVLVGTAPTSNSVKVQVANATDVIAGIANGQDGGTAGLAKAWATAATSDTITMNGTTTGGRVGDFVQLMDAASGLWVLVDSSLKQSGTVATPFSAAVA